MTIENTDKAYSLFKCIGEIDDSFVEEAQTAKVKDRKLIKYGAIGVGASALAYFLIKSRKKKKVA